MNFRTMTIEDIIKWCQENNQVDWLKREAAKKSRCKIFPRKTIVQEVKDANGNITQKKSSVADKSQPYHIEERPITFVQIKTDFVEKFMPEIAPSKHKKPNMFDIINNL